MKRTVIYKMVNLGTIAAFGFFGLIACNNDDYKRDDSGSASSADSSYQTPGAAQHETLNTDTSAGNTAKDNGVKSSSGDGAASAAAKTGRKRKAMISWTPDNTVKIEKDKEGVYNRTDVMPEFPGGQHALADYVNNHLDYPQQAIDDNTVGTVKVSFVVDEHGKVSGAHLLTGNKVGNGLDEQAVRVVNSMPAWKPGKVNGKNVKTRLELPISFQLEA